MYGPIISLLSPYKDWNIPSLVDTISISAYKLLGTPYPFGILLTNEAYYNQIKGIPLGKDYVKIGVTKTIAGIRSSLHTFVLIKQMSGLQLGMENSIFERLLHLQLRQAEKLVVRLKEMHEDCDASIFRNILHIVMPRTYVTENCVLKYSLMICNEKEVSLTILFNVTDELIEEFLTDIKT